MAKEVAALIKLQIKGELPIRHHQLDLRWVQKGLISWSSVSSLTLELRIKWVR